MLSLENVDTERELYIIRKKNKIKTSRHANSKKWSKLNVNVNYALYFSFFYVFVFFFFFFASNLFMLQ